MYRIFTTEWTDAVEAASAFKPIEFNGLSWLKGKHKNKTGVFGVRDLEYKGGYGPPIIKNNVSYQATDNIEIIKEYLPKFQTSNNIRISVRTYKGIELQILPALAEPREFLFGAPSEETEPFRKDTVYGQAAWAFLNHQKLCNEEGKAVYQNDPTLIELAKQALINSYEMPFPIWDCIKILTLEDIDLIASAAMGVNQDFLSQDGKRSDMLA